MSSENSQSYIGRLAFTPLADGIHMELIEEFGFLDRYGSRWMVPKGARVDGAPYLNRFGRLSGALSLASIVTLPSSMTIIVTCVFDLGETRTEFFTMP
jgi:hypothetical protein